MRTVTTFLTDEEKERWMQEAIIEAKKAELMNEVPIGAVVVHKGEVIGRGFNQRETSQIATTHAELLAIQDACETLGSWRLDDTQLFVTLEPCPMCSGAIILSRIPDVYFGTFDPKSGTAGSIFNLLNDNRFNHTCFIENDILQQECSSLLTNFFRVLRQNKKNRGHPNDG